MRKISFHIYIMAFIITTIIFMIGFYVGKELDKVHLNNAYYEIEKLKNNINEMELFLIGNQMEEKDFCPFYKDQLSILNSKTEKLGWELTYLEEVKNSRDDELKKEYFILEGKTFFLSKKVKELCGENFSIILYFYSNKNCTTCKEQGKELLKLKGELKEKVRIYSFDGELGSSFVEGFKNKFNIRKYPTIIILNKNETIKKEGMFRKDAILPLIS